MKKFHKIFGNEFILMLHLKPNLFIFFSYWNYYGKTQFQQQSTIRAGAEHRCPPIAVKLNGVTAAQKPCNTSSITHQCSQCLQTVKERIISLLHFSYATFAIRPKDRFFWYKFYISCFCNHSQKKFQSKSKTFK